MEAVLAGKGLQSVPLLEVQQAYRAGFVPEVREVPSAHRARPKALDLLQAEAPRPLLKVGVVLRVEGLPQGLLASGHSRGCSPCLKLKMS